jgi:hypothetical protein
MCLVVTPQFATSFYFAYGRSAGDPPPPDWLSNVDWPNWFGGSTPILEYHSYGVVFGFALLLVTVSLGVLVSRRAVKGRGERRGWRLVIGGLGAVGLGAVAEYGIPDDIFDPSNGFGLELLGFLILAVGTPFLGWAIYRETGLGAVSSVGIAALGPTSVIGGFAVNGHIPSGPAALLIVTAVVIGGVGLPGTSRT